MLQTEENEKIKNQVGRLQNNRPCLLMLYAQHTVTSNFKNQH